MIDVGTGSGVIALTLAAEFPKAEIVGTDISEDALMLARENADRLDLADHVQFLRSNLLESVQPSFDLIVANLPYVSIEDRQNLSREVLHDPEVALFAGVRGDELMRQLIAQAPSCLRPGGMLAMEIGIGQSEALVAALAAKNYRDIWTEKDYSGVIRFLFARYG
jgi:release factor glutamine methyltransferase